MCVCSATCHIASLLWAAITVTAADSLHTARTHPLHTHTLTLHTCWQGYQCCYKPKKFNFANDKRQRLLQITKPQHTHTGCSHTHTHTQSFVSVCLSVCVWQLVKALNNVQQQPQIAGVQTLIKFLLEGREYPLTPPLASSLQSHQNLIGSFRSRLTSVKHTHTHTHAGIRTPNTHTQIDVQPSRA